jgi:hypothetical protein
MLKLSAFEADMVAALVRGETFDPLGILQLPEVQRSATGASRKQVIRAEVLRALALGLPVQNGRKTIAGFKPNAFAICGAVIAGDLDLREANRASEFPLTPLLLEYCRFGGEIKLDNANIARLSLKGSRFTSLDATGCVFSGNLEISDVASSAYEDDKSNPLINLNLFNLPPEPDDGAGPKIDGPVVNQRRIGICKVTIRNTKIGGDLRAANAKLCCEEPEKGKSYSAGGQPLALSASGASIDGYVLLQPGFVAIGGIAFNESRIAGSVWLSGCKIRALDNQFAILARAAHIQKDFILRPGPTEKNSETIGPFECLGGVSLQSSQIDGTVLVYGGTSISSYHLTGADDASMFSIVLHAARMKRVEFGLQGETTTLDGYFSAYECRTDGEFSVKFVRLAAIQTPIFTAEKRLGFPAASPVNLMAAKIGSHLVFDNAHIEAPYFISALDGISATIEGDATLCCEVFGNIDFSRAKIAGELRLGAGSETPNANHLTLLWQRQSDDYVLPMGGNKVNLKELEIRHSLEVRSIKVESMEAAELAQRQNSVSQVRVTPLPFYPGWVLLEAEIDYISQASNEPVNGVVSYLAPMQQQDGELILLDGTSPPIHAFNGYRLVTAGGDSLPGAESGRLQLPDDAVAFAYLKFFCAYVWGEAGSFAVIESFEQLPKGAEELLREKDVTRFPKPEIKRSNEDFVFENVCILHSGNLFRSRFRVQKSGMVEMEEDEPIADLSSLNCDRFEPPVRIVSVMTETLPETGGHTVRPDEFAPEADQKSDPDRYFFYRVKEEWERTSAKDLPPPAPVKFDMTGLSAGNLDDQHGEAWFGWQRHRHDTRRTIGLSPREKWRAMQKAAAQGNRPWINLNITAMRYDRTEQVAPAETDTSSPQFESDSLRKSFGEAQRDKVLTDPSEIIDRRMNWLWLQFTSLLYEKDVRHAMPDLNTYSPHAFEQVAKALRAEGWFEYANDVLIYRYDMDNWLHVRARQKKYWSRPSFAGLSAPQIATSLPRRLGGSAFHLNAAIIKYLFGRTFGYGLKPALAFATFLACIIVGWLGVTIANNGAPAFLAPYLEVKPVLIVETVPMAVGIDGQRRGVGPLIFRWPNDLTPAPQMQELAPVIATRDEIPCDDQINEFLYAVDVFIPLLDLRQETVCRVNSGAWGWALLKALYAIIGWIVTSLTILTVSGVLRRSAED